MMTITWDGYDALKVESNPLGKNDGVSVRAFTMDD